MGFFLFINDEVMSTVSHRRRVKEIKKELDYLKSVMRPKASEI
jgi:hypothetical protein